MSVFNARKHRVLDGSIDGMLAGFALDFDFTNNKIYGLPTFESALSCTRTTTNGFCMIKDSNNNYRPAANNQLRYSDLGLLVEETRANGIGNVTGTGAAAGNPGTMPSGGWFKSAGGIGLSEELLGAGTENGIKGIYIRFWGTANNTGNITIGFPGVTAATGQTWSGSYFWKLIDGSLFGRPTGSLTGLGTFVNVMVENTSGGAFVAGAAYAQTPPSALLQRTASTRVFSGGGTVGQAQISSRFTVTNGATIDITLFVGTPQLEQGAFVTSPNESNGSSSSRAFELINLINPNIISFAEGSFYAEVTDLVGAIATYHRVMTILGTSGNSIRFGVNNSNKMEFVVNSGGVPSANPTSTNNVTAGTRYKIAGRWKLDNYAARYNGLGAQPANDNSGAIPVGAISSIAIGSSGTDQAFNGYIHRMALSPLIVDDNRLLSLVS